MVLDGGIVLIVFRLIFVSDAESFAKCGVTKSGNESLAHTIAAFRALFHTFIDAAKSGRLSHGVTPFDCDRQIREHFFVVVDELGADVAAVEKGFE